MNEKIKKEIDTPRIGGLAGFSGVTMSSPLCRVRSRRCEDGRIETVITKTYNSDKKSVPGIRGLSLLAESFRAVSDGVKYNKTDKNKGKRINKQKITTAVTVLFIFVLIFVSVTVINYNLKKYLPASVKDSPVLFNFISSLCEFLIIFLFTWIAGKTKYISRLFKYHGAEHKTINCFENGYALTVKNVMNSSRFHNRCGTNLVALFSIAYLVVNSLCELVRVKFISNMFIGFIFDVIVFLFVFSIIYELTRYAACHDNLFSRIILTPGRLLQRITTKEPDPDMCEVALASLNAVLKS